MRKSHDVSTGGIIARLDAQGINAMYGSSKGDGFWLALNPTCSNPADVRSFLPLLNDGKASGNPYFWMRADTVTLLEQIEAHPRELTATEESAWLAGDSVRTGAGISGSEPDPAKLAQTLRDIANNPDLTGVTLAGIASKALAGNWPR